jgi:general secretion pathway protein L
MAAIADSATFRSTRFGRDLARRFGLTGFGRWWAQQLAAMLPARLRAALEHRRARPVLAFDGSRATLWQPTASGGRVGMAEVAQIPLYADAETVAAGGRAALAPLARAANGAAPEVVVSLSPRNALRKRLTLPAAIEGNLHQALAYDLDRHTPFKADELYFDATIVDRDSSRNTLDVELAAARRAIVDPMLRHAENFGARVVAVTIDPPAAAPASRHNLLPGDRRSDDSPWLRWHVIIPAALLIAGAIAALVIPVWQKRVEAISLNEQSDAARQRATVSDALRTELDRRVGEYNFALERKYAFPGAVQVLDDITRILPDDTWLTQLELRGVRGKDGQRELTLRGESANAGRLVSLLEESKLFTQSAPRSPTTKIQPGPGEIFDVGAQLKPLTPPPAAPLDVTARPAPAAPSVTRAPPAAAGGAANAGGGANPQAGAGAGVPAASSPGGTTSAPPVAGATPSTVPAQPSTAGPGTVPGTSATAPNGATVPGAPASRSAASGRSAGPGNVARPVAPLAPTVNPAATGANPAAAGANPAATAPATLEPPAAAEAPPADGEADGGSAQ